MNKIKFLSCAVMAVFFAMGITSCEKENFSPNVDIEAPDVEIPDVVVPEGYKPGDAVISITPQVIAVIDGKIENVTNDATITYNGNAKLTYTVVDKCIAAMDVTVAASYVYEEKTYTTEYTISVPALSAGQVAVYTPTLVISINTSADDEGEGDDEEKVSTGFVTEVVEGSTLVTKTSGKIEFNNESNYYFTDVTASAKNEVSYGTFISNIKVAAAYQENTEVQAILGSFNQGVTNHVITVKGFNLWPNTKTCFAIEQIKEKKDYVVKEVFETRATTETVAATFTVTDYSYVIGTTSEYYNAGETGHYHGAGHAHSTGHGHGHGHGHGYDNAGGGIVWGI